MRTISLSAEDIRLQFIEALANEDNNELNLETYEDPPLDAHEAKADIWEEEKDKFCLRQECQDKLSENKKFYFTLACCANV